MSSEKFSLEDRVWALENLVLHMAAALNDLSPGTGPALAENLRTLDIIFGNHGKAQTSELQASDGLAKSLLVLLGSDRTG